MLSNGLFYRVLNERTIIVAADQTQKRQQYEEQVIRTFFISHADASELNQLLTGADPRGGHGDPAADLVQQDHQHHHHSRHRAGDADRREDHRGQRQAARRSDGRRADPGSEPRAHQGLRARPGQLLGGAGLLAGSGAGRRRRSRSTSTRSRRASARPTSTCRCRPRWCASSKAIRRPRCSPSRTCAAREGQKLSLNLGEDVPVPSTTFTPLAGGGSNVNPLTSYGYRTIGIIVEHDAARDLRRRHHPRDHDREQRARPGHRTSPARTCRRSSRARCQTKLRLRDGESNLLAGLLREDERKSLTGFPGIMRLPIVKQLFSNNDSVIKQTDIVMLLTPRIMRTHELRASDLSPIYIGTQSNMALTGPPVTIGGAARTGAASASRRTRARRRHAGRHQAARRAGTARGQRRASRWFRREARRSRARPPAPAPPVTGRCRHRWCRQPSRPPVAPRRHPRPPLRRLRPRRPRRRRRRPPASR